MEWLKGVLVHLADSVWPCIHSHSSQLDLCVLVFPSNIRNKRSTVLHLHVYSVWHLQMAHSLFICYFKSFIVWSVFCEVLCETSLCVRNHCKDNMSIWQRSSWPWPQFHRFTDGPCSGVCCQMCFVFSMILRWTCLSGKVRLTLYSFLSIHSNEVLVLSLLLSNQNNCNS